MDNIDHLENKLQALNLNDPSAGFDRVYHEQLTDTKHTGISPTDAAEAGFQFFN